jgi:uncharacterized protein (DUF2249 family)
MSQSIDVRPIPGSQKHALIFQTFRGLGAGETFELINDHDPKPLYYQFKFEEPQGFIWEYLEEGPQVWRVKIGKVPEA